MFISKEHHSFMDALAAHLETGAVVPAVGDRFSLDEAAEALRRLGAGHTTGKSVIVVGSDRDAG